MRKLTPLITAIFFVSIVISDLTAGNAGTETALFLNIPPSARTLGMGETFVAVADDGYSLNWNPAGLGRLSQSEFGLTHFSYLIDTDYNYASYVNPIGKYGTVGLGGILLNSKNIPKTTEDASGNLATNNGNFDVQDMGVLLGWGMPIRKNLAIGTTLKHVNQKIDTTNAGGFAGDVGVIYAPLRWIQLGTSLQNVGPKINGDDLPTIFRFGCVGKIMKDLIIPLEFDKPLNGDVEFGIGAEKWFHNLLALRLGYKSGVDVIDASGLRLGTSFQLSGFRLDYAYADYGQFDAIHQISLSMKFGKEKSTEIEEQGQPREITNHDDSSPKENQDIPIEIVILEVATIDTEAQKKELFNQATKEYTQGNYGSAIELWKKVLELDPNHELSKSKIKTSQKLLKSIQQKK